MTNNVTPTNGIPESQEIQAVQCRVSELLNQGQTTAAAFVAVATEFDQSVDQVRRAYWAKAPDSGHVNSARRASL